MLISRQERARICSDTELGAGNVLHRLKAYDRPLDEPVLRTDGTWQAPDGSRPDVLTLRQLCEAVETYAGFGTPPTACGPATRSPCTPTPVPRTR